MAGGCARTGGTVLLDGEALRRTIVRIAHEVVERTRASSARPSSGSTRAAFPSRSASARQIEEFAGQEVALGTLDITFHRDDVHARGAAGRSIRSRSSGRRASTSRSRG